MPFPKYSAGQSPWSLGSEAQRARPSSLDNCSLQACGGHQERYLWGRRKGHRLCCPVGPQMSLLFKSSWILGVPGKLEGCLLVVVRLLIIHLHMHKPCQHHSLGKGSQADKRYGGSQYDLYIQGRVLVCRACHWSEMQVMASVFVCNVYAGIVQR